MKHINRANIIDIVRGIFFRRSEQKQLLTNIERISNNIHVLAKILNGKGLTVEEALAQALQKSAKTITPKNKSNDYERWYKGLEFTEDWTSHVFDIWSEVFEAHGGAFKTGLEIGSFEGRSAVFFLECLPNIHLTCVDLFEYTDEFFPDRKGLSTDFFKGKAFDRNLKRFNGRYEKVISYSFNALSDLLSKGRKFDFIYIDGSHFRDDVFVDAILAWKCLNVSGIIIFDDYFWRWDSRPEDRPKDAIEYFVYSHLDQLEVIHVGAQFIIKKL